MLAQLFEKSIILKYSAEPKGAAAYLKTLYFLYTYTIICASMWGLGFNRKLLLTTATAISLLCAGSAYATNGYFAHGYGTNTKALAGAGVAWSQDSLAAATNPAGMSRVGSRMDGGLALFHPERNTTIEGSPSMAPGSFPLLTGRHDSGSENFPIPHLGYNRMINADMAIGVSIYGNGGMNTNYEAFANPFCPATTVGTGLFCDGKAGVNLMQLFIASTFAQNIGKISWGISPILAVQKFQAKGLGTFGIYSSDPQNMSRTGTSTSTGGGIKVGIMGDVSPQITLGASYQSKLSMSEFDEYKGLFAEQGDFDIPSTWTVGLNWKANDFHRVVFDVQRINYSEVAAVANPMSNLSAGNAFGTDNGPGFGWEDMMIAKLGWEFSVASLADWTWRLGFSHGDQPIPESEVTLNILAPGVVEDHFTFGFSQSKGSRTLSFAGMYGLVNSVKGKNSFDQAQTVTIKMDQFEYELSYSVKF